MLSILKKTMISSMILCASLNAHADLKLAATRVIYEENKEAMVEVKNLLSSDDRTENLPPVLIQSYLENWMPGDEFGKNSGTKQSTTSKDFILTPPLFRLDAKAGDRMASNKLRILYNRKANLPEDRESIYWLTVKSIPLTQKNQLKDNMMTLNLQYSIKLIYRPAKLNSDDAEDAGKNLKVHRDGNYIVMKNESAYVVSLGSLKSGGKKIDKPVTLKPFSEVRVPDKNRGDISWTSINDFGGQTQETKVAG